MKKHHAFSLPILTAVIVLGLLPIAPTVRADLPDPSGLFHQHPTPPFPLPSPPPPTPNPPVTPLPSPALPPIQPGITPATTPAPQPPVSETQPPPTSNPLLPAGAAVGGIAAASLLALRFIRKKG